MYGTHARVVSGEQEASSPALTQTAVVLAPAPAPVLCLLQEQLQRALFQPETPSGATPAHTCMHAYF